MPISFSVSKSVPKTAEIHVIFAVPPSAKSGKPTAKNSKSSQSSKSKNSSENNLLQLKAALTSLSSRPLSNATAVLKTRGFTGKAKEVELVTDDSGQLIAVVGLGDKPSLNDVREGAAALARLVSKQSAIACFPMEGGDKDDFAEICGFDLPNWAKALSEGITLGAYRFTDFKSQAEPDKLSKVTVVTNQQAAAVRQNLNEGARLGEAVCRARDLVNEPGGSLTPERFARLAKKMAEECGLKATIWNKEDIKRQKLGGVMGVNRGRNAHPDL